MADLSWITRGEARSSSIENPTVPVSASAFMSFFGMNDISLPAVTIDSAMGVPAVHAAVSFLSRSMAALPLHVFRKTADGPRRIEGKLGTLIEDAPNPEWTSFSWRAYCWQQTFTGGRAVSWIERAGNSVVAIWPMDPRKTTVRRVRGQRFYKFDNKIEYPSSDVIDVSFMLKADQLSAYGPIKNGAKEIGLAIAMSDYARTFFGGGGVPPLALVGPLPTRAGGMQQAMEDIDRVIREARASGRPVFPLPPGHELKPVGFEPDKGQMVDAQRFAVEQIARLFNLPPVFLQDLTRGTFTNTEQQDLHLVKHLLGQWATAFEQELNLKLFGQLKGNRYVEHNLDGVMRGDFATRMDGLAKGIQNAILTPNEARAYESRPAKPGGDELLIQGATVPLGSQPQQGGVE